MLITRTFFLFAFTIISASCGKLPHKSPLTIYHNGGFDLVFEDEVVYSGAGTLTDVVYTTYEDWSVLSFDHKVDDQIVPMTNSVIWGPQSGKSEVYLNEALLLKNGMRKLTDFDEGSGLPVALKFKTPVIPGYLSKITDIGADRIEYLGGGLVLILSGLIDRSDLSDWHELETYGHIPPSAKLSDELAEALRSDETDNILVDISTFIPESQEDLSQSLGDSVVGKSRRFLTASLSRQQIIAIARLPSVSWVESWSGLPQEDDNLIRISGGAAYLANQGVGLSFLGKGIKGHVLEGVDPSHPDFAATEHRSLPIGVLGLSPSYHGQASFGVVFGSGRGDKAALGILPEGQGYYTNYGILEGLLEPSRAVNSRYELTKRLVNNEGIDFQTASWGFAVTTEYTARSLEMDELIFDIDIPIVQSQSNQGSQESRPQAWAKNIISVGAIYQNGTADRSDDSWSGSGTSSSIGPSADGRIKPDLVASYDGVLATAYDGYRSFSGSSAATSVVAGYLGLVIEMLQKRVFGDDIAQGYSYTVLKALLINSAQGWEFEGLASDLNRFHQGWGYPNVETLYRDRDYMTVIDRSVLLPPFEGYDLQVEVEQGRESLVVTLVWSDPPGSLLASKALVNNLDLMLVAPDGREYRGNWGLKDGNVSVEGGQKDLVNTVENCIISKPMAGLWSININTGAIGKDGFVYTPELDTSFSLVVRGALKGNHD
ncbi:MAG: hypothetical protein CMP10_15150 [Zetaproteobacteria bacterium]|nr:hypothetical protein [Pseudobdellovibrionaceae bacterium]